MEKPLKKVEIINLTDGTAMVLGKEAPSPGMSKEKNTNMTVILILSTSFMEMVTSILSRHSQ